MSDWIYDESVDPSKFYGFVYLITRTDTGRKYIGRKYITMSAGKRKGRKTSNWKSYWGSCKPLLEEIKLVGKENYRREIIRWCDTRGNTNYAEVEEQFKRDVLNARLPDGTREYYNGQIMCRWYAPSN